MKILVTGAAGMIGSHLCDELLSRGHRVIGIDDLSFGCWNNINFASAYKNFTFIKRDVTKGLLIPDLMDVDIIYHLASLKKAPNGTIALSDVMMNNALMAHTVSELAIKSKAKIVFTSTSDVYSNSKTFDENDPLVIGPTNITRYSYALSKLYDEQLFLDLFQEGKIQCTIFRVFGCFSERSSKGWSGGHIPIFIHKALNNQTITVHGDGLQTRSMCYVSDIIKGLISPLDHDLNGEIINIGSSEEMSVLESAQFIINACHSRSIIEFVEVEKIHGKYPEIIKRFANTNKAARLFGYKADTDIKAEIKRIIDIWGSRL